MQLVRNCGIGTMQQKGIRDVFIKTEWAHSRLCTSFSGKNKRIRPPAFLRRSSDGSPEQSSSWRALHSWLPPSSSYTAWSSSTYIVFTNVNLYEEAFFSLFANVLLWEIAMCLCCKAVYLIVGGRSLLLRFEEKIQFARILPSGRLNNQGFPAKITLYTDIVDAFREGWPLLRLTVCHQPLLFCGVGTELNWKWPCTCAKS